MIPIEVLPLFANAYFGGRFEASAVGVAETVYEMDLCSAYPAAMVDLPCQACGQWWHNFAYAADAAATLCHVTWAVDYSHNRPFAPLPWRHPKGTSLFYPRVGSGWYWGEEVAAAQRAFPGQVEVDETWSYVTDCEHMPFAWMAEVYQQRQQLGKTTAGKVLKLAMNSAYGVLARTIGGGGRYSNPFWAGLITAKTRAKLLDLSRMGDCLMVATDACYFSEDITGGHKFDGWELRNLQEGTCPRCGPLPSNTDGAWKSLRTVQCGNGYAPGRCVHTNECHSVFAPAVHWRYLDGSEQVQEIRKDPGSQTTSTRTEIGAQGGDSSVAKLGDWEDGGQVGPLLLVQPGLYLSLNPDGKKWRTRGVSLKVLKQTDGVRRLTEAWRQDGAEASVEVSANFLLTGQDEPTSFIGTKLALAWGKPEKIGTWEPVVKRLSFRPEPRRERVGYEGELLRTRPPMVPLAALVDSAPYKKLVRPANELDVLAGEQLSWV